LHNAPGFEEADGFAVGKNIGQCGNTPIWIDGEEPVFLLGVFANVDFVSGVGQAMW
jgi:hypothetical protein